jgi:hypothetical protein
LRYGAADGSPVYGGAPLGPIPSRSGDGQMSPSFRPLWRR